MKELRNLAGLDLGALKGHGCVKSTRRQKKVSVCQERQGIRVKEKI